MLGTCLWNAIATRNDIESVADEIFQILINDVFQFFEATILMQQSLNYPLADVSLWLRNTKIQNITFTALVLLLEAKRVID